MPSIMIDTGGTDSGGSWRPTFDNDVSWPSSRNNREPYRPYTPTRTTPTRAGIRWEGWQQGWMPGAEDPYYYPSWSWNSGRKSNSGTSTDYANRSRQVTLEALRAGTARGNSAGMSPMPRPTSGKSYPGGEPMSRPGYQPPKKRYLPTSGTAGLTNAQRSALNADRQRADEMYYGPEGRLAQMVQQGLGLNLIPYDEEIHNEAFIGFAQDFGPGSYIIEQVGEDYRKRMLTYRRGMERLNPQASMGWSRGKVTDWRANARFLSQFIDFGSNSPMGTDPGVWTEGDAAAMEWMMAAANETGRDVEQVMAQYLQAAESGTLDAELMGGSGPPGSGSAQSQAREVTRTDTTFALSDLDDARTLIAGQMRNLMGRDPSDSEVSAFLSALNTKEKATPSSIVVTNAEYDERGDLVSSTSRQTQGDEIDRAAMARDEALEGNRAEMRRFHMARAQDVIAQMVGL